MTTGRTSGQSWEYWLQDFLTLAEEAGFEVCHDKSVYRHLFDDELDPEEAVAEGFYE